MGLGKRSKRGISMIRIGSTRNAQSDNLVGGANFLWNVGNGG